MSSFRVRYFPQILAGGEAGLAEHMSDETLMCLLQNRDIDPLDVLYRRYYELVYSVCSRILRDSAEAEDVAQKIFSEFPRKCRTFDPAKGTARTWIIHVAYSEGFNQLKYLRARHGRGQGSDPRDASSAEVAARTHDPDPAYLWNRRMLAAFRSLSKEQQLTLVLYYFHGYTFEEIGEKLGYTYGNVKHHVYRGIARLRRMVYDGAEQRKSLGDGR